MKITKVSFTRKFNLGNYESLDVAAEAELNENDNALEVWSILKDNAEMWFIDQQRKDKKPSPTSNPQAEKQSAPSAIPPNQPAPSTSPSTPHQNQKWEEMAATENNKGIWYRCTDTADPEIQKIIDKIYEENKPIFKDGFLYWIVHESKDSDIVIGLGRRRIK